MNRHEYLQYLKGLVGDDTPKDWEDENTFGLFQHFRPLGVGVEKALQPVPGSQEYIDRILPVYRATSGDECARDLYFVVRSTKPFHESVLVQHGSNHMANLRQMAETIGDQDLREVLTSIDRTILSELRREDFETEEYLIVYETIGDWLRSVGAFNELIACLREAYYSIACDYWLSNYLCWPKYSAVVPCDAFLPYYEIWRHGCSCTFRDGALVIGKHA